MKKVGLIAIMLSLGVQAFAQDLLYEAKIKKEEVPDVIITAVGRDYPGYVMEEFSAVPLEYVDTDVYINKDADSIDDYDTFEITLSSKGKKLTVDYDRNGNRLSALEHEKNVVPPAAVRDGIAGTYPGWTMAKDVYNMTHYAGDKERQRYRIELTKNDDKMYVYTDADGRILNNPKERRMHRM